MLCSAHISLEQDEILRRAAATFVRISKYLDDVFDEKFVKRIEGCGCSLIAALQYDKDQYGELYLSPKMFSGVHNAKCEMYGVLQWTEDVLKSSFSQQLRDAIADIDKVLRAAYELDDQLHEERSKHYDVISDEISAMSIWSMHEIEDLNTPHPFPKATYVIHPEDDDRAEIKGPNWKDLYQAADQAIRLSGDNHHIFIEGFEPIEGGQSLRLILGS